MAGWFNREIRSVADLAGLKMRIPGLGAEALQRAGGIPVSLPGSELFGALKRGAIDATEWVGPYNDLAFGLYRAAKYYYYPGWHEPGAVAECLINKKAYDSLPKRLQSVVMNACRVINQDMLAEYTARNNDALETLVVKHKVQLRRLPDPVLVKLRGYTHDALTAVAADPLTRKVYESYLRFRDKVVAWHDVSERAYLNARAL
jgi:TRAP-type mannitol/chloroaromatic compound transport system substrate-binding protein